MPVFHILNGDCLQNQLRSTALAGQQIVMRECLLVGNVLANSFEEFIAQRSAFIAAEYGVSEKEYARLSENSFLEILGIPEGSEVYLRFENDLFCQVNMWYVLSLLAKQKSLTIHRIFPPDYVAWDGFALLNDGQFVQCLENAVQMEFSDIQLACNLWDAYAQGDTVALAKYAAQKTKAFQLLPQACAALIDDKINATVLKALKEIVEGRSLEFKEVFNQFSAKMGVFGYGDLQVQSMLKQIKPQN